LALKFNVLSIVTIIRAPFVASYSPTKRTVLLINKGEEIFSKLGVVLDSWRIRISTTKHSLSENSRRKKKEKKR